MTVQAPSIARPAMSVQEAYCAGRAELAASLLEELKDVPAIEEAVRRMFWTAAWADADGQPHFFFPPVKHRYRFDVIGFEEAPVAVRSVGGFLRLPVTTCWYLPLCAYASFEEFLRQISHGSRKKYRGLERRYAEEGIEFVAGRTEAELEAVLEILLERWPDTEWGGALKPALVEIFRSLERRGLNRTFLLRDKGGRVLTGSFGWLSGGVYNGIWLIRRRGVLDDYSTGFQHTVKLIEKLYAEGASYYIMGPGEYDRKRTFRAHPLPIFRYEKRSAWNLLGILRLYSRLRKERRKRAEIPAAAEGTREAAEGNPKS